MYILQVNNVIYVLGMTLSLLEYVLTMQSIPRSCPRYEKLTALTMLDVRICALAQAQRDKSRVEPKINQRAPLKMDRLATQLFLSVYVFSTGKGMSERLRVQDISFVERYTSER